MKTQAMHDKLNYPFRAWTIWLLSAIFMFFKFSLEVSPSVMTSNLMTSFNISGAALGNLAACYFYAYLILQMLGNYYLYPISIDELAHSISLNF